jgi:hypothetical protein
MTQTDWIQQLVRIMGYFLTPILIRWGLDAENTTILVAGVGTGVGLLAWWGYWQVIGRWQLK